MDFRQRYVVCFFSIIHLCQLFFVHFKMWFEHERYKNNFLQMQLKHLQPQEINDMVNLEIRKTQKNIHKTGHKVDFVKGDCKNAFYFEDRTLLAYGFWALPKLIKELNSDHHMHQWRAINSLSEYVINPLFAQTALTHKPMAIVRRCQNLFLRIQSLFPRAKSREIKRLLVIFYYFALHRNGAQQILDYDHLLDQFYQMIGDRHKYMESTSKILALLSADTGNCLKLIDEYKVFDKLYDIWNRDHCVDHYPNDLWLHLVHILEQVPQEGVNRGFFEILHKRIKGRLSQYHIWDMKCWALLLRCQEGQQRFRQVDGIKLLHTLLNEEALDDFENVVFALMQGLLAKICLWRCREFTNFPLLLTSLAKDPLKSDQQLYCLQSLREMGVMPVIKRFMKKNCLNDLRNLQCDTECNERERQEIVYWLQREIYHTSDLRNEALT